MENRDFSSEFVFITSRSGGAGGQNVNKVNTKAELRFDIEKSQLLSETEKLTLKEKLKNKITNEGILQIVSQEERSQLKNKELCINKFYEIVTKALIKRKKRKKIEIPQSLIEERLKEKKRKSQKKDLRKKDFDM